MHQPWYTGKTAQGYRCTSLLPKAHFSIWRTLWHLWALSRVDDPVSTCSIQMSLHPPRYTRHLLHCQIIQSSTWKLQSPIYIWAQIMQPPWHFPTECHSKQVDTKNESKFSKYDAKSRFGTYTKSVVKDYYTKSAFLSLEMGPKSCALGLRLGNAGEFGRIGEVSFGFDPRVIESWNLDR